MLVSVAQNGSGQLIFYERPDTDGPKLSRYSISPTSEPQSLQVKQQNPSHTLKTQRHTKQTSNV